MLVTGRKLPIGIQTFEDIRNDGYLYVDKTALMWTIANIGKPFFHGTCRGTMRKEVGRISRTASGFECREI